MTPTRSDLELANQILTHDASDKAWDDELRPVYDLAVELACRIVERDRQQRQTYERARLAEVATTRRLYAVREANPS